MNKIFFWSILCFLLPIQSTYAGEDTEFSLLKKVSSEMVQFILRNLPRKDLLNNVQFVDQELNAESFELVIKSPVESKVQKDLWDKTYNFQYYPGEDLSNFDKARRATWEKAYENCYKTRFVFYCPVSVLLGKGVEDTFGPVIITQRTTLRNAKNDPVSDCFIKTISASGELLSTVLIYEGTEIGQLVKAFKDVEPKPKRIITINISSESLFEFLKVKENRDLLKDTILQDILGNTPLHLACTRSSSEVVKVLLDNGDNPNIQNLYGITPLYIACRGGRREVVEILLNNGANPNIQDDIRKDTPLHRACRNNHKEVVKILLDNGANQNIRNKKGHAPLDRTRKYKNERFIEYFHQYKNNMFIEYFLRHIGMAVLTAGVIGFLIYKKVAPRIYAHLQKQKV